MTRLPNTLQLTLTWLQTIVAASVVGGSILYACVEIRIAVNKIQEVRAHLAKHEERHEALEKESRTVHTKLDRRLSRIEGANGR